MRTEQDSKLQRINAMEVLLEHSVKHARSKKCCQTCTRPLNPSELEAFLQRQVWATIRPINDRLCESREFDMEFASEVKRPIQKCRRKC